MKHTRISKRDLKRLHSKGCERKKCLKGNYCECFELTEEDKNKYKSQGERAIAEYLHRCHIGFTYECKDHLRYFDEKEQEYKPLHPDFCIKRARFGGKTLRNVHIEFLGMEKNEGYRIQNQKKYTEYWTKKANEDRAVTIICVVQKDIEDLQNLQHADDVAAIIENCELTRKLLTYKDNTINFAPEWIQVLNPRNK